MSQTNKNCNKNRKLHLYSQKSDGFENDGIWHTYDVIMTSWYDIIMSWPLWGHLVHIIIKYINIYIYISCNIYFMTYKV